MLNEFDIPVIDGGGRGKDCKKRTVKRVSKEVLVSVLSLFCFISRCRSAGPWRVTPG